MKVAARCLKDEGLFLLHTITGDEPVSAAEAPWLNKYIFPNGELPSLSQITRAAEGVFITEAFHQLRTDYERTLGCWFGNFVRNWPQISSTYDERFYRMWTFYLQIARGIFQSRIAHLWQIVFSKDGIPGVPGNLQRYSEFYEAR
jgi:cyclopropane-fatty-acyl-phospholipid synthase